MDKLDQKNQFREDNSNIEPSIHEESELFSESEKSFILHAMLESLCGLTPDEITIFTYIGYLPENTDVLLAQNLFTNAKQKVFVYCYTEYEDIDHAEAKKRRVAFDQSLEKIMSDFLPPDEFMDFLAQYPLGHEMIMVMDLLGSTNPMLRRIRAANYSRYDDMLFLDLRNNRLCVIDHTKEIFG